jgi:hypothetical protein
MSGGRLRRNLLLLQSLSEYRRIKLGTRAEEIRTKKVRFGLNTEIVVGLLSKIQGLIVQASSEPDVMERIDKMTELFEYMSNDEVYASILLNKRFYEVACRKFKELYDTVVELYPSEKHKMMPYVDVFRFYVFIPFSNKKPICLDTLEDKTCMICYDANVTCQTNCHHNYCENCINTYFRHSNHTNCPYCRSSVKCFTRVV